MAKVTIRDLTAASSANLTDLVIVRQGSDTTDKSATLSQVLKLASGSIPAVATVVAAKATTGTAGDPLYVVEKQGIYQYCSDCTVTADDDLILTTGDGGNTRWQLTQKMSRTQGDTGWIERDGATITATDATHVRLALSSAATFALKGVRFQLAAGNYDAELSGAAGVKFIGFNDTSGTLSVQTTVWDFNTQIPVAIVYWSGTAIVAAPQTEMHGIRDNVWHYSHHFEFGLQLSSGLTFTGAVQTDNNVDPADDTCTYLWSTDGAVVDEDYYSYPGTLQWAQTLGSALTTTDAGVFPFMYHNGSTIVSQAAMADRAPFIHAGGNTAPQWENAGTLTAAVTGDYIVYHYFATPMVGGWSVFARPHNAKFTSLALAQGARPNSLTWLNRNEVKHLYSAVWRVNTTNFTTATHRAKLVGLYDYRYVPGTPTAGISATNHQSLSNRDATGAHPETAISFTDVTTNNASTSAHGFMPKLVGSTTEYDQYMLTGRGTYARVGLTNPYNFFDNPNFIVNQRHGAAMSVSVTTGSKSAISDRWRVNQTTGAGGWTVSLSTTVTGATKSSTLKSLKLLSANAGGTVELIQRFTADQVKKMLGNSQQGLIGAARTIAFYLKMPAGVTDAVTVHLGTPSATNDFTTVTTRNGSGSGWSSGALTAGTWNLVSYTNTENMSDYTDIDKGLEFKVVLAQLSDTVAYYLQDFQWNVGLAANAFVHPDYHEELWKCFAFFVRQNISNVGAFLNGQAAGAGYGLMVGEIPRPMIAKPQFSTSTIGNFRLCDATATLTCTSTSSFDIGDQQYILIMNGTGGSMTAGRAVYAYAATSGQYFDFSSEL